MLYFVALSKAIKPVAVAATCGILALLAACGPATPTPTLTPNPTPPSATTEPTKEVAPTAEALATDTAQPTFTSTPVPSATPTEIETSTPTPSPTETEVPIPSFTWQSLGLEKIYLRDIALLAGGNNVVLVASSDGLWKTTYDYKNWEKLTAPPSGNPPPGNAELAMSSSETLYLARHTGCASGLPMVSYHSTDGGQTWPTMSKEITSIHASNASTVYATTCSGVIKSTDAGATWSDELAGSHFENADPYAIVSSADGESVYVAYASEGGAGHLKRSTGAGADWQDITPQNAPDGQLVTAPDLVFQPGSEGHPDDGGLYMANNQGVWFLPLESDEWVFKPSVPAGQPQPAYYVTAYQVDTTYSVDYDKPGPVMYEARAQFSENGPVGLGVFRSTNGGKSWQRVGDDLGQRLVTGIVVAPHDTAANPGMVETLIATTEDGVWGVPMPPPFK